MNIKIKSIAFGKTQHYIFGQKEFDSAYKKDQFINEARVNKLGIIEDEQVDKRYHGGEDKAIHIGSYKHLENNPDFDKLSIGCNILIEDVFEEEICIGDIYKIGEVLVEVTQPRQPCWKIGALFGKKTKRYIYENHATGWYVRILKEGIIKDSDEMLLERRISKITIKDLSKYLNVPPSDRKIIEEILSLEIIANSYKDDFFKALKKNNS